MNAISTQHAFAFAPHLLSGTVYVALMNQRNVLAALGDAVHAAPYKAAPRGVVLAVKPRNTFVAGAAPVLVDAAAPELELSAGLGLVIGRTACALAETEALAVVAGYVIVADFSVPQPSFYRPSVRQRARDASCAIGPTVVARAARIDPDRLAIRVFVGGRPVQETSTGDVVRRAARLLADVTDFMTLVPGDVLMTGGGAGAPRVRAGAAVAIEIDGLGRLETRVAADPGEAR